LLHHRAFAVGQACPLEHLDGDGAIQRNVLRAIDDAHSARADFVNHDVFADLL
jgi:hypothetical protein